MRNRRMRWAIEWHLGEWQEVRLPTNEAFRHEAVGNHVFLGVPRGRLGR